MSILKLKLYTLAKVTAVITYKNEIMMPQLLKPNIWIGISTSRLC